MPFKEGYALQFTAPNGKQVQLLPTKFGKKLVRRLGSIEICNDDQRREILAAFAYSAQLNHLVKQMGGTCETLADKMLTLTNSELLISCDCIRDEDSSSDATAQTIQFCKFPSQLSDLVRIVMREQIRLAGGMPIDVWGVDAWLWNKGSAGYSALDPRAKPAMCAGSIPYYFMGTVTKMRYGNFIFWDPVYGGLYSRKKPVTGQPTTWGTILTTADNQLKYTCP